MSKATGPLYDVHFRRRREGRTNYAKRLALLKSSLPRMVIRKSTRAISAQLVEFDPKGDKVICTASTRELAAHGFNGKRNVPSAYLVGFLIGKKALSRGAKRFIADFGLYTASKGGILFAVVKGALDAGLESLVDSTLFPLEKRIKGEHIGIDVSGTLSKIKEAQI
ncbi:50S ribosomal protein L18 [Candidatus Micrarchaeota archaeon]|nr:50S ribosomal protein L18 [Candidatus Micrarchaeota archaeon]